MRKVLDASCFQDPALEEYLRASPENTVVFTDFACMETYKPASIANIHRSLRIASRYPTQVVVLKPTLDIIRLQDRDPHVSPNEFVDPGQTNEFAGFCKGVWRAAGGDQRIAREILQIRSEALRHFEKMLSEAESYAAGVAAVRSSLRPEHLRVLRERAPFSREDGQEMIRMILVLAATMFRDHPEVTRLPKLFSAACKTHIFRVALANYLLTARWIADGGAAGVKPDRLRNDVVDMTYVAYGTRFDGVLSRDNKMQGIYEEARFLLDEVFVSDEADATGGTQE